MEHIEALGNSKDNVLYIFSLSFFFLFYLSPSSTTLTPLFFKRLPCQFLKVDADFKAPIVKLHEKYLPR